MKIAREKTILIPFSGLKEGKHQFDFDVDKTFFEQFEKSIIEDAEMHIKIDFEKKPDLFNLTIEFYGTVHSNCDRCNEAVDIHIKGDEFLIVKFGEEEFNNSDEIKLIPYSEYELNLNKEVYEFIHLHLPTRIVHQEKSECNQEAISKLEELSSKKENEETDPRWAALSKLKKESNK